ncbi:MAG: tRNA uracil 4-sulfurtransferase ThiI [Myxococcota bacterium]|nr:tRNA uracil 4-sulfurtransferase ThiI [Myxococcota bacterium]
MGARPTEFSNPEPTRPASERNSSTLVRLGGDIATKGRETRRRFVTRLIRNMKDALRQQGIRAEIFRSHDRIRVESPGPPPTDTLSRIFGVQSVSPVEHFPWNDLDDIVDKATELFGETVRDRSFAIRARRVGNRERIAIRSNDLKRKLGTALLATARCVDLDRPEVEVQIEVMPGRAAFFTERIPGPGGLPLGVEGRAVALVSGGFDSAVAVWHMMKRGVSVDFVFCNLGGRTHQLGALRVLQRLAEQWCAGTRPRFHAIDFDIVAEDLQKNVTPRYLQVVLKRHMLRAAEHVASSSGALAIITGDAMGQVSSQTLQNMAVVSEATRLPILRPLVGLNKDEILASARHIGTYELSKVVGEYCALVPRKPATSAALEAITAEERRLTPGVLESAFQEMSTFDLGQLDLDSLEVPGLEVDAIEPDQTVLDLRSRAAFDSWHHPGALFLEFAHALRAYPNFSRDSRYLVYCEFGLKSAHLVELMRKEGFDAVHFRGGVPALLRWHGERN